ncbi:MAG: ATP-binding cassette domain-containing protein, partial [Cellvibrionaceae bacterium]|nr:ATP-binding cassette domain-containing protein [Cellvibrionaceae bacterium]
MTIPYLTLQGVSYSLPDGRALFSNLSEQFDCRATGLVGPNGIGKTVLAKILAGAVPPSDGQRRCSGRVYYLAQQVSVNKSTSVAELAGVQQKLAALERIAAGSCDEQDFAKIGDDWDIRQRLVSILTSMGLGGLDPQASASQLSGGEAMSVALAGA